MNTYIKQHQGELDQAVEHFKKEISTLRTGRANPSVLDSVLVESYGAKVPLQQVGSITVPEPRCIVITPWDKNVLKEVEKAIVQADLGLTPVNEGDKIRITVPVLTEESRFELVKKLNEKMESSRITIRQTRDKIREEIISAEKNKEISEDDKFKFEKELDEEVRKFNSQLQEIRDGKEKEIMTV